MDRLQRKYYDLFMKGHALQTEMQEMPQDLASPRYRTAARVLIEIYAALEDWHYANELLGHIVDEIMKTPDFALTWPEALQLATMAVVNRLEGKVPAWQEKTSPVIYGMLEKLKAATGDGSELEALFEAGVLVREIRTQEVTPDILARIDAWEKEYLMRFHMLGFLPTAVILWEMREHYHFRVGNYAAALACLPEIETLSKDTDFEFLRLHACQMEMGISARLGDYRRAVEAHDRYAHLRDEFAAAQEYAYSECLIAVYGIEQKQRIMEKLRNENRRLEEESQRDPLTHLYNRQYLQKFFVWDADKADAQVRPLAAVMLDIDHFKGYNDHYGHIQGDAVLSEVGRILWAQRLKGWTPVRYGGEEFLLLRETSAKEAVETAEEVRRELEAQQIPHHFSKAAAVVTMSAGVSAKTCMERRDVEKLIGEADRALYAAKERGRNVCVRYSREMEVKA
ncbi:MAG: diguanylate cyclase [Schwartzia sp. (in: firmicutes)]